jgi:predicted kinase
MQQLIITVGLPASGKSTFAKAWVLEDPTKRIRVNRDDIRRMLGPYWVPSREDLVTAIEVQCIIKAIHNKFSVIVDATNFKDYKIKNLSLTLGIDPEIKDFTNISLEECIARDAFRDKEEQVGEEVIRNMYNKYLKK